MGRKATDTQKLSIGWLLFSTEGRLNRKPYIIFVLLFNIFFWVFIYGIIIINILQIGFRLSYYESINTGVAIAWVVYFFAALPARVKRCHDRGRGGWFVLLFCVPILSLWPIIELIFFRGTIGDNEYGKDRLP
jgi:uncharacterized membrane protein YhaH (DUF805 family)